MEQILKDEHTIKKPCKPILKIAEQVENIDLQHFLYKDNIKETLEEMRSDLKNIINQKKDGYDYMEAAQIEDCLDLMTEKLKEKLNEKVSLAIKTYANQTEKIEQSAKEFEDLDEFLKDI